MNQDTHKLKRSATLFMALIILVSAGVSWLLYRRVTNAQEAGGSVGRTNLERYRIEALVSTLAELESSYLGYAAVGDSAHLRIYNRAKADADRQMPELRELLAYNPLQTARLDTLTQDLQKLLAMHDEAFRRLAAPGASGKVLSGLVAAHSSQLWQKLQELAARMQAEENRMLAQQSGEQDSQQDAARFSVIGTTVMRLLLLLGITIFIRWRLTLYARLEAEKSRLLEQALENTRQIETLHEEQAAQNEELKSANERLAQTVSQLKEAEEALRTHAERELREKEERLDTLLENMEERFLALDADWRITHANAAFVRATGIPREHLINRPLQETFPEETFSYAWEVCRQVMAERVPKSVEAYNPVLGQWAAVSAVPASRGGVAVFIRNITKQKQLFEQLEKANAELQLSLSEKQTLLAEVHHRVKNNLAVISGLLGLQASKAGESELGERLREGAARVQAIAMIHEQLYTTENFASVDLARSVGSLTRHISGLFGVKERGIRVEVETEEIRVGMDKAVPFALVLNEVLTNACKHAFEGLQGGEITVTLAKQGAGRCILEVKDNGRGFDTSGTAPLDLHKGILRDLRAGLGMTLIQGLTRQLGGRLEVESTPGEGSSFRLSIPM